LKLFEESKSWADAETTCINYGGHLATIESQAQNDWIAAQASYYTWHGATDQFSEGTWTDAVGQNAIPFYNWNSGEPNGGTGESCGMLYAGGGKWNDSGCGNTYHYACGLNGKNAHIL